jgi:negative regulator of sigma-B (phosphoserine phosphatase)
VKLNIATVTRPRIGETENGDGALHRLEGELRLWAVVDALGHGAGAAQTARVALTYLREVALTLDVAQLIEGLGRALKDTRGAVALILLQHQEQLIGGGVGNISFRASRPALSVLSVPGVLGVRGGTPKIFRCKLQLGDRVAVFSDGISGKFSWEELYSMAPEDAAAYVTKKYGRDHDDATISIADVIGDV